MLYVYQLIKSYNCKPGKGYYIICIPGIKVTKEEIQRRKKDTKFI